MKFEIVIAILTVISLEFKDGYCLDREMTIIVNAKEKECFYESVPANHIIDMEYQVIDGGQGDLDINFDVTSNGRVLHADFKKSDNIYRMDKPHSGGEYQFCFDNTISHFNSKTVFFELIIEDPNAQNDDNDVISEMEGLSPEEFYEMKVQDIQDIVHTVKSKITRARQLQDLLRSFEARDRNIAELNNERVSLFSIIIIVTMLCVGFLQVFMIRSLFETDPKGRRVWAKITKIVQNFK
ncbi:hypothetical protein ACKWTF_014658 [Chironomus riparius]